MSQLIDFRKRPTLEELEDHKWLLPNEFMVKKREAAIFPSKKLSEYSDEFHKLKSSATPKKLLSLAGLSSR